MPIYFDQARRRWRFDFRRVAANGARHRATKLLPQGWSRAQAAAFDAKECARLYLQTSGAEEPRLTLAGAVKLYLDHRVPQLRSGKNTAQELAHLLPHIERAHLDDLPRLATDYAIEQQGKLAAATIRNRLAYLRAAVTYAYRVHAYGDRDYTERMILPAVHNARHVYKRLPELEAVWQAIPHPEARAMFKAALYLGLRWRSELLPREPTDVQLVDGQRWLDIRRTKSGQPTMKPIHPAAEDLIRYLPWSHGEKWFYAQWHAACDKLNLKNFVPHDLRHCLASAIISAGGTLDDAQGALHHVSRQSTARYAHLYSERLRDVMLAVGGQKNATHPKQQRPDEAPKK